MITNTTKLCGSRATHKNCDLRVNKQKILSNTNIMKEMKKDDLSKLTKDQLINLVLNQNKKIISEEKRPIPKPRKNVKQMVQDYEDNIILPPLEFRDKPVPKPRKNVKQMVQDYEDNIIEPPLEFRDKPASPKT